jgi:hypothetical protein
LLQKVEKWVSKRNSTKLTWLENYLSGLGLNLQTSTEISIAQPGQLRAKSMGLYINVLI